MFLGDFLKGDFFPPLFSNSYQVTHLLKVDDISFSVHMCVCNPQTS